ncbi:MAG: hypothetical protein ACP5JH_09975 [Bacteroidota bacterium]
MERDFDRFFVVAGLGSRGTSRSVQLPPIRSQESRKIPQNNQDCLILLLFLSTIASFFASQVHPQYKKAIVKEVTKSIRARRARAVPEENHSRKGNLGEVVEGKRNARRKDSSNL